MDIWKSIVYLKATPLVINRAARSIPNLDQDISSLPSVLSKIRPCTFCEWRIVNLFKSWNETTETKMCNYVSF